MLYKIHENKYMFYYQMQETTVSISHVGLFYSQFIYKVQMKNFDIF